MKNTFLIFLICFLSTSCIEEYWPELKNNHDDLLVIDGKITNAPGPYTIILSKSSSITPSNSPDEFHPLKDAVVQIADSEGNIETLSEIKTGVYTTSVTGIQGIIGRKYKLIINTKDGEIYQSEFEEILNPVEINSITTKEETLFPETNEVDYRTGFQFYLSTETSDKSNNYYTWELEETYEYHSNWEIVHIYNGYHQGFTNGTDDFRWPSTPDTLFYCWKTNNIGKKITFNTAHLSIPQINNLPLIFVQFNDEKLKYKYSLLVKQLTISKGAYAYLNILSEQDGNQEGLYTNQPSQIQGNVFNVNDSNKFALGYFIVAGITEGTRLTVEAPTGTNTWESPCFFDLELDGTNPLKIEKKYGFKQESWPLYVTEIYGLDINGFMSKVMILPPSKECIDCTKKGGVTKKPDYWDQ